MKYEKKNVEATAIATEEQQEDYDVDELAFLTVALRMWGDLVMKPLARDNSGSEIATALFHEARRYYSDVYMRGRVNPEYYCNTVNMFAGFVFGLHFSDKLDGYIDRLLGVE